jgi:transposase
MCTPLSKQRNKHIQRVLVEAAKLAPRQDHDLALVYETEKQKGNANRATLAVARKDGRVSARRGSAGDRTLV